MGGFIFVSTTVATLSDEKCSDQDFEFDFQLFCGMIGVDSRLRRWGKCSGLVDLLVCCMFFCIFRRVLNLM